jgi:ATP-dependent DNA ligase
MLRGFPDWLVPMAATLTQERFTGPEWIFERKYDGIRLLAFKQGSDVRLFSRNRLQQNCPKLLLELRARLDAIEVPKTPFTRAKDLPRLRAHWVRPEVVVQVAFIEWTVHGKLRHPRLLGVRYDKVAREVVRETS